MKFNAKKKVCFGMLFILLTLPTLGHARLTNTAINPAKKKIVTKEKITTQVIKTDSSAGLVLASTVLTDVPSSGSCEDKNGDSYTVQTSNGYDDICFENTLSNCRDGQITTTYVPSAAQTSGTLLTQLENCLCEFSFETAIQVSCDGSGSSAPSGTGGFSEVLGVGN